MRASGTIPKLTHVVAKAFTRAMNAGDPRRVRALLTDESTLWWSTDGSGAVNSAHGPTEIASRLLPSRALLGGAIDRLEIEELHANDALIGGFVGEQRVCVLHLQIAGNHVLAAFLRFGDAAVAVEAG